MAEAPSEDPRPQVGGLTPAPTAPSAAQSARPAGWYPDPHGAGPRFWDGAAWTDARLEPPSYVEADRREIARGSPTKTLWLAGLSALSIIVGGIGTWAQQSGVASVGGRGADAWIVIGAGAIALAMLAWFARRRALWAALVTLAVGAVAGGVSGVDLYDLAARGSSPLLDRPLESVGWGLYLDAAASGALILLSLGLLVWRIRHRGSDAIARPRAGAPAPRPRPRWRSVPVLAGAGALLLACGAVAVAVSRGGGRGAPPPPVARGPSPSAAAQPRATAGAPAVDAAEVRRVITRYARAYSAKDPAGLRALLSTDLVRRNSSDPPQNLRQSVREYKRQFGRLSHPSYRLSAIHVIPGPGEATARARYRISSPSGPAAGRISFHLVLDNGGLVIDRIRIKPR